jgi:hypothetical protein
LRDGINFKYGIIPLASAFTVDGFAQGDFQQYCNHKFKSNSYVPNCTDTLPWIWKVQMLEQVTTYGNGLRDAIKSWESEGRGHHF